ncbi:MAG: transporter [Chloroflexota bacterium]|nr:transporter [Chloroflexota bacterium]
MAQQAEGDVQQEAEESRRALEIFLREQRVIFRRGELALELDTFYSTDTRDQFVRTTAGGTALARVTTRTLTSSLTPRFGLLDRLELDLEIPFGYAQQAIDFGVTRFRSENSGLGDIEGRLRYQLWYELGARPDLIVDLSVKSTTGEEPLLGTGHWNVGGGVALVKTLDPVVFFGRLGYLVTLERAGRDPGDQLLYQVGMGYSFNDRVSYDMRVSGTVVREATLNGRAVPHSSLNIITLQFGVTVRATRHLYVEPLVAIGLTNEAPDVIVGVSVPFTKLREARRQ